MPTNQRRLFDDGPSLNSYPHPLAHKQDPPTSKAAARLVEVEHGPERRKFVYELVRRHPGLTADELWREAFPTHKCPDCGVLHSRVREPRTAIARYLSQLLKLGVICIRGERESPDTGRMASCWWPTEWPE